MKRICAFICVAMIAVTMLAPACFAANDIDTNANKTTLTLESSSPENGAKGVAVDNFSIKMYFSKDVQPKNKNIRAANAKMFRLTDSEGNRVPVRVYYSSDEEGLMLVAADLISEDKNGDKAKIKGDEEYTLTIKGGFEAADGSTLGKTETVTVKTLNQARSTAIYMVLMVAMMGGMVFFTIRSTKKADEKEKETKATEGVNPYKEAKRTGKSVEEIVAKENKKKQKREEALAKKREAEAQLEAEILEKMRKELNKRVAGPAPISKVGSTYKPSVKK